jgi:hypothetical protein
MSEFTKGRLVMHSEGYLMLDDEIVAYVPNNEAPESRRLVAAWNACEGVSTEYLEQCTPDHMAQQELRPQRTDRGAAGAAPSLARLSAYFSL